jgi:hypothetical protein
MIPELRLLQLLHESQIEFVIVGGVAVVIHGSTLVTKDLDICLRFDERNLKKLGAILSPLNAKDRLTPQRLLFEINDKNWHMLKNIYLETDWGILDCLGAVLGIGSYDEVVKHSVLTDLPFGKCAVLSIDSLIRAKEAIGRPHDMAAARQLRLIKQKRERG